jgi:signal transduction histidine kinase
VWADEERLQQIILNLLTNASKYSPEGSKISLRGKQENDSLVVQVADTGPGIPREDQKRIFKPYQRYNSGRESLSGLGLGLSLCKSLVELHGGKIWMNSKKGSGTTFTFSIPLKGPATDNSDRERLDK